MALAEPGWETESLSCAPWCPLHTVAVTGTENAP
jgi:hypothetical protein